MDRSDIIALVDEKVVKDEYGVPHTEKIRREVFARVDSVTASEFFDGGRNGLNPEFRMTMFSGDYEGERMVWYAGNTYAIYRTYKAGMDTLELYVQREGGTNGKTC